MKKKLISALFAAAITASSPASANDSSAAIGLGGIELTHSNAISMDSEELFLSRERVTVKYRFTNVSAKDVETLVSFPLPAIPGGVDGHVGDQGFPTWPADLDFKTKINGKPVKLDIHEIVSLIEGPKMPNVESELKKLGWPMRYWEGTDFEGMIQNLPMAQKLELSKKGLLRKEKDGGYFYPNWQVQTHVTRKQIFPAGKSIVVEHSYTPVMGGSVSGSLLKQYRTQKDSGFADYAKAYCIDKTFLTGFDRKMAAQKTAADARGDEGGYGMFVEQWLSYVLKSGANWKGPIKDFRLVVDKGKAENLVSFCMDGVTKISPTKFEVRKKNFEPTKDLNILIVDIVQVE